MKRYRKSSNYPELYQGKQVCCTCTHFVQHYRSDEARAAFVEMGCGHCGFPRLKRRSPEQTCDNWRPAERQEPVSES